VNNKTKIQNTKTPEETAAFPHQKSIHLADGSKGVLLVCPTCKKEFIPKKNWHNSKRRFCSYMCNSRYAHQLEGGYRVGDIVQRKDVNGKTRNLVYLPKHPHSSKNFIVNARWVMEKRLRRFLHSYEIVHHINNKQDDDRVENLRVFRNRTNHILAHNKTKHYVIFSDNECVLDMVKEIFGV